MENFSEYLDLNTQLINQCFNIVTQEGKNLIFFDDVVEIISYYEEAKLLKREDEEEESKGLNLSPFEIKVILENIDDLVAVKTVQDLTESLNGYGLMFVVDYESVHGRGQAPAMFPDSNFKLLFKLLIKSPSELVETLEGKLKQKNIGQIESLEVEQSLVISESQNQSETQNNPVSPSNGKLFPAS